MLTRPWREVMSCMTEALPSLQAAGLEVDKLVRACEGAAGAALGGGAPAAESGESQIPFSTSSSTPSDSDSSFDLDGPPRTDRPIPTPRYRAAGYPLTGTTLPSSDETPGVGSGSGGFGSGGFGLDGFVYSSRCASVMQSYNRFGCYTPFSQ